ncbi:hypothetical protein SH467x_002476 [Pirellulaceae bacterium SH467]
MSNNNDAKIEEVIDAVSERSGLSRDIVKLVIDHLRSVAPIPNAASLVSPQKARILPEIRFDLREKNRSPTDIDPEKLTSNRSKLGGRAEWIHEPRVPVCCGRFATCYAQIDTNLGPKFCIADAGVLYVFVCDQCLATFTELQFY